MAQELKHVGRVKATNKKCLIAYRTLPGEAHYCLIVPTENLPDIYHDALINLVESNAGQESYEFAEAMDRTQFPDGSRMLPALHATGRLIKVATGAIEMTPTTGYSLLLSELNQVIAEQRGVSVDETEARFYRSQADKMAKQAAEMRRKAEELVPTKKKV